VICYVSYTLHEPAAVRIWRSEKKRKRYKCRKYNRREGESSYVKL